MSHFLTASNQYPKFFFKSKATGKMSASVGKASSLTPDQNCVCSFHLQTMDLWSSQEERLVSRLDPLQSKKYTLVDRINTPCFETWKKLIRLGKSLDKIVLARKHTLIFDDIICPFDLLQRLLQNHASHFLFLYQKDPDTTFLGASPETLFYRKNNTLFTQALAGTQKRGKTLQEDKHIEKALLNDAKELQEFSYVKDDLKAKMDRFCSSYKVSSLGVLKTLSVQHLQTTFQGILKKTVHDLDLVKSFHPTPAVGGVPISRSLSFLKTHEPFERGYYAAPIGKISKEESEFAVAIRSCMIYKNTLSIYSGTGIVQDSDPKREWEELNDKMKWILDVIN